MSKVRFGIIDQPYIKGGLLGVLGRLSPLGLWGNAP